MFELIRDAEGSDQYVCLYSLGLAEHGSKEYAEADFVVIGPEGVFCIEAKGGQVLRRNGSWTIGPPGNSYTSEEGPFKQSAGTVWPVRKHLERRLGLKRQDCLTGWGVAFPHITFDEQSPDWRQEVIYDERDRNASFVSYIRRLDRHHRERLEKLGRALPPRLNEAGVTNIARCLRPDITAVPTVKGLIADSRRELASLSSAQFRVLDFALNERNPRLICEGAAGTGKTLIAIEAARRLAGQGLKVLLLCFNDQLRRFLALDASDAGDGVKISTVHSFMAEVIRKGGLAAQLKAAGPARPELFETVLPALFDKAAEALVEEGALPLFDVIVLDEAQDVLNAPVMNCLDLVLQKGFAKGRWLICMDAGLQAAVYGRMSGEVLHQLRQAEPAEFSLTENFRNPKNLVTEMCVITKAERPQCMRDLPSNVDYRLFGDDRDEGRKLKALLVELIRDGASPGDITILSARAKEQSCIARHPPDMGKPVCFIEDQAGRCPPDVISAASVSGFKGLENEIIVLTDVPPLEPMSDWTRSVLYVGMTRPRAKLYLLVNEGFLDARTRC